MKTSSKNRRKERKRESSTWSWNSQRASQWKRRWWEQPQHHREQKALQLSWKALVSSWRRSPASPTRYRSSWSWSSLSPFFSRLHCTPLNPHHIFRINTKYSHRMPKKRKTLVPISPRTPRSRSRHKKQKKNPQKIPPITVKRNKRNMQRRKEGELGIGGCFWIEFTWVEEMICIAAEGKDRTTKSKKGKKKGERNFKFGVPERKVCLPFYS